MTRSRLTTIVLGGALLTSWLVATAGPFRQTPPPPVAPPPAAPSAIEVLAATVRDQADGLRIRLDRAPAPRDVMRNPFAFAPTRRETARQVVATATAEPPPAAPPAARAVPPLRLVAIVTDQGARRAVLSSAGEIAIVSVGDTVAGRYRVVAISADVVELEDDRGGPTLRLGLG